MFITVDELLTDPEPLDIPTGKRVKDKKSGELVDATLRFYLRRPTDTEKEMCTGAANAARRVLRRVLADESTEEHRLRLREPLEDSDDDALRSIWVNGNLSERVAQHQLNSLEEREVVPEPEGDIVPAKVRDEYEDAVDGSENDRMKTLLEVIGNEQRSLMEEAKALDHDVLLTAAIPAHIETIVANEWNNVYTANLISRCTFTDARLTKDAFKTVTQVDKLRSQKPNIYRQLADTHRALLLEMEPSLGF